MNSKVTTKEGFIVNNTFVVLGMDNCDWCTKVTKLIKEMGYEVEYKNLSEAPNLWLYSFMKQAKLKTVPQVFSPKGSYLGGYEETKAYLNY